MISLGCSWQYQFPSGDAFVNIYCHQEGLDLCLTSFLNCKPEADNQSMLLICSTYTDVCCFIWSNACSLVSVHASKQCSHVAGRRCQVVGNAFADIEYLVTFA